MLNISSHSISQRVRENSPKTLRRVESRQSGRVLLNLLAFCSLFGMAILFVPWTQNIRAKGFVTTLTPDQRPQTIQSVIGGRIEKWFVREGDLMRKGDTILFISETKDEYFDPQLLSRTEDQLQVKELSVRSYMDKVKALDSQIDALIQTGKLKLIQTQNKLQQAQLKVRTDSIDYQASKLNYGIALEQYQRMEDLFASGLKSKTDLEARKLSLQKTQAEMMSYENKLLTSRNELINSAVEIQSVQAKYRDEVAKAESDKYTALSSMYDAEAAVTKLQGQYLNYSVRTGMYYITAPQDGYITRAIKSGIGETVKPGDDLVSIMPSDYQLAVEMYVRPIDLPLMDIGQQVRIQFDGWPAIVFSGWPNTSYGTYGGKVFAIDNFTGEDGQYRVLIAPDSTDYAWPDALRVGAGTMNLALLKDVPIWYELWRIINGFPPDYYKPVNKKK